MLSVATQIDAGHSVALVSSGAIAAGREALGYPELSPQIAGKQMLAAVGQARLMQLWAEVFGIFERTVGQVLLTRGEISGRAGYLNARDALTALLDHQIIPIINENDTVATDEIRVGDNDTLSALVANLIDAELLVLATDQLGLFTSDPRTDPNATRIAVVKNIDEAIFALAGGSGSALGTGGMTTKLQAAQLAGQSGTTTVILSLNEPNALEKAVLGSDIGTRFLPTSERRESRARWLLSEKPAGQLVVDAGAARRLKSSGASLLPIGVLSVVGVFERGDVVSILSEESNAPFAIGVTAYSSRDIAKIKGQPTSQIALILGDSLGDELVHRDNFVLLT
jgi:glutamate 5-kinase